MITKLNIAPDSKKRITSIKNRQFNVEVSDEIARIFPLCDIDSYTVDQNRIIIDSSFIFRCIKDCCNVEAIDNTLLIRKMNFNEQIKHLDRIGTVKLAVENNLIMANTIYGSAQKVPEFVLVHGIDKTKNIQNQCKTFTVYTYDENNNVKFIKTGSIKIINETVSDLIPKLQSGEYRITSSQIFFNINNVKGD